MATHVAFFLSPLSRYAAYLRNTVSILETYHGEMPLAHFLKLYFKSEKKFGANDRRQIATLCYRYFRLGNWGNTLPVSEKVLLAEFLMAGSDSPILMAEPVRWSVDGSKHLFRNGEPTGILLIPEQHCPWHHLLQPETQLAAYTASFMEQPDLFLRVRPGKREEVLSALQAAHIPFKSEAPDTLRLPNTSKMDTLLKMNRDVVVQDLNSQRCGEIIKRVIPALDGAVWDVCAASGGKSMLLWDLYNGIKELTVSDIRKSILKNLNIRFREANITGYKALVLDAAQRLTRGSLSRQQQVIIVDAPCSGSGTWARTPEQHQYFDPGALSGFHEKQFRICLHAARFLADEGYLIYITCSVFETENIAVVERLSKEGNYTILHSEVLDGTRIKADSMFLAILKKG
jgi:16S rRNA (cytosine967-C5)-methyltransferase